MFPCKSFECRLLCNCFFRISIPRFQPHYKCIRNVKSFNKKEFIDDFSQLPVNIVFSTDDPEEQLELFNKLFCDCLERHTPLQRTRITRHVKSFNEKEFIDDFSQLPVNIVFSTDDPEEQLELFNKLFCDCLERHTPLRRTRITRHPAPWIDNSIKSIQKQRDSLRRGSSDWFAGFPVKITRNTE